MTPGNQGTWPAMHQGPRLNELLLRTSKLNIVQAHSLRVASLVALNVLLHVPAAAIKVVIPGLPTRSEPFVSVNCLSVLILGKRLCHIHGLPSVPRAEPS